MVSPSPAPRRRLAAAERQGEILDAAAALIDAQGFLPLRVPQLARAAGVSNALIYAYFPTQAALANAVLRRALTPLLERIGELQPAGFEALAVACAEAYFDAAAGHGALLHILCTDPSLDGQRDPTLLARRDAAWRRLIRASRSYVALAPRERVAALAIILSLPEETARLARRGEIARGRARTLCASLVLSALRGLTALLTRETGEVSRGA
ncbi:MAG TPA: TetR family transcriptional regulator [Caulobacteraceae bacterium]|jgi:AcrR family transcriptional regulator|nr:TetR family transcriptional regulator [Caulobacteraceae bacterium]